MTNQYTKMGATILAGVALVLPAAVFAQGIGAPCDGPDCTFDDLIILVNNVVKFLMYQVAVPLAALGIAFSGAKLVFSQNKEGEWSKAKESFENIGIGFLIMIGAFLLIKFVLFMFLSDPQKEFVNFLIG